MTHPESRFVRNTKVMSALRRKFEAPEWAFFEEVPSGTGGSSRTRADALAMNMWPSRGLELHGFEVKVDPADWRSEKKRPDKAEEIARFCDRWWLVVDDMKVIGSHEVPAPWGVYLLTKAGLRVEREAKSLEPVPMTRSFIAAILRKASEDAMTMRRTWTSPDEVHVKIRDQVLAQVEQKVSRFDGSARIAQLEKDLAAKSEWTQKLGDALGLAYPTVGDLPNIARVMKALKSWRQPSGNPLRREAESIREFASDLDRAAKELDAIVAGEKLT